MSRTFPANHPTLLQWTPDVRFRTWIGLNHSESPFMPEDTHHFGKRIGGDSFRSDHGYHDSVRQTKPGPRIDDVRVTLPSDLHKLLRISGGRDGRILDRFG